MQIDSIALAEKTESYRVPDLLDPRERIGESELAVRVRLGKLGHFFLLGRTLPEL